MASIRYPCYIEFSDTGKTARLVHKSGMTLAEMAIHGPFAERTNQIHTHACVCGHSSAAHHSQDKWAGVAYTLKSTNCTSCKCPKYEEQPHETFQCEVYGLAAWETIDKENECVTDHTGAVATGRTA